MRQRTSYPKPFKAQIVQECLQPGVSMASVALRHAINAKAAVWGVSGCHKRPLLAVLCRSSLPRVLVKSNANGWSARVAIDWSTAMQMGGQVHAITQLTPNVVFYASGATFGWGFRNRSRIAGSTIRRSALSSASKTSSS
ncbi:MAG: transposase [Pseudomonas sp.]